VTTPAQLIAALYDDPEECARVANLRYVSPDQPGLTRVRCGRGFTYRDADGRTVTDVQVRDRIAKLVIPPAWRDVWICATDDGHIAAVGEDDRGRRQYLYHERWRSLRDQLNFYRLVGFGEALPTVRQNVESQLRRRSFDTDRVLGAMLRIIDVAGLRVGNEVYAEENDSYGLSTLTKRHVQVRGARIELAAIPLLPTAKDHLRAKLCPAGSKANRAHVAPDTFWADGAPLAIEPGDSDRELLASLACDAQTSGGLLLCTRSPEPLVRALRDLGLPAAQIGELGGPPRITLG